MKSNRNVIVAKGEWASDKLKKLPCVESPRGKHQMQDVASKPGINRGERLVTSECKHCGCRIVDCPTIGIDAFILPVA